MAVFVTGDTHGDHDFAKLVRFSRQHEGLTKRDYLIIAGDFGGVWWEPTLEKDLKPYEALPFTVLFVDGNHENFSLLERYPVERWKGGKVHVIKPGIIHLMRGQVFELEGSTIFTFGGATSIDRVLRREGVSWWKEELPSPAELAEGIANLKARGNKVDYIITHSCGERALMYPPLRTRSFQMDRYPENQMLAYFEDVAMYKRWYFGHYHLDGNLNDKMSVLYQAIVPLGEPV